MSMFNIALSLSGAVCVFRLVAKPCANILQIQAGESRRAQPNAVLERVFTSTTVLKALVSYTAAGWANAAL